MPGRRWWQLREENKALEGPSNFSLVQGDHRFLGQNSSSSFNDTGRPWSIEYGKGSVSGTLVTDRIQFAGCTLPNHTFGVARNESPQFTPYVLRLTNVPQF
jgi:hypothetical protein